MFSPDRYAELRQRSRIGEALRKASSSPPNELELQARWFAGDFGRNFRTLDGDEIELVQFGVWNREAGPDFSDAVVRLNGGAPLRGSIEFDLIDQNWETHGHATNPAFAQTILHVFVQTGARRFFTRTEAHREVPQVRLRLESLTDSFALAPPLAHAGRCQAPLQNLPETKLSALLESAAQFRLQQKAARLRHLTEAHGRPAAIFQETAGALGYKQNKLPFTLLAQRLPLETLRRPPRVIEPLLFGVAGFLVEPDLTRYAMGVRDYVRSLWDLWWPQRDSLQRLILPANLWRLSGTRPLNHPQRRLAALAALARRWPEFYRSLGQGDGAGTRTFLLSLSDPFWSWHYTLRSATARAPMALLGESRAAEILANVIFPLFHAEGQEVWPHFARWPARLSNRRLETGAARLFGPDPRRQAFLKTVAHQQGLLQIYEDFCLQDNSDCAHCPFPEQMKKWK